MTNLSEIKHKSQFIIWIGGGFGKDSGGGWKWHFEYLIAHSMVLGFGIANTWRLPSLARAHGDG